MPTPQFVHALAPDEPEYRPTEQSTQVVDKGWPVFGEYWPAAHWVQDDDPVIEM